MKKLASLLLVILLLSLCILPAAADVLWEPYDNTYYRSHHQDMTTVNRTYYVPDGLTVNFYSSPEGGKLLTTLHPGTRVYVGFSTKLKGEVWGVGYPYGDWNNEGWFRLGRLQLEYDSDAFYADHSSELDNSTVSIPGTELTGPVYSWTYPGSGISDGVLDLDWSELTYNNGNLDCSPIYTDPDGGRWGHVGYFMGHFGWVYLDDPHTESPPTFPLSAPNTVTDTAPTEKAPTPGILWIVILVAAVMVLTALLLIFLKRKRITAS